MGFAEMCMEAWSSHPINTGPWISNHIIINFFNQKCSQVVGVMALYLSSELELATAYCFLLFHCHHVTTTRPPITWCESLIINRSSLICGDQKRLPLLGYPFKYIRISHTTSRWGFPRGTDELAGMLTKWHKLTFQKSVDSVGDLHISFHRQAEVYNWVFVEYY